MIPAKNLTSLAFASLSSSFFEKVAIIQVYMIARAAANAIDVNVLNAREGHQVGLNKALL